MTRKYLITILNFYLASIRSILATLGYEQVLCKDLNEKLQLLIIPDVVPVTNLCQEG